MRVTLKHLLPLALVLTSVAAQKDSDKKDVSTDAEVASTATDKTEASATKDKDEKVTETGSSSSSKDDDKKTTSKDDSDSKSKKPTATVEIPSSVGRYSFEATMPATTAPDINASGRFSARDSSFLALSVAVGAITLASALL